MSDTVKVKVLRKFIDVKADGTIRLPGQTFETTDARYKELLAGLKPYEKGKGQFITIDSVEKQPKTQKGRKKSP